MYIAWHFLRFYYRSNPLFHTIVLYYRNPESLIPTYSAILIYCTLYTTCGRHFHTDIRWRHTNQLAVEQSRTCISRSWWIRSPNLGWFSRHRHYDRWDPPLDINTSGSSLAEQWSFHDRPPRQNQKANKLPSWIAGSRPTNEKAGIRNISCLLCFVSGFLTATQPLARR